MSDSEKPVGLMVRLPPELHRAVVAYAAGSDRHAETSLNKAVVYLLRAGLAAVERATKAENEPGQWVPELLETVEV
jgi:hypothetical protein